MLYILLFGLAMPQFEELVAEVLPQILSESFLKGLFELLFVFIAAILEERLLGLDDVFGVYGVVLEVFFIGVW